MTSETITRKQLKAMINRDDWREIGRIFSFVPVFMLSEGGKRYVIDWRCVPPSVSEILWKKNESEMKAEFSEQTRPTRMTKAPPSRTTRVKSPNEMRQLEHFGDAIVNLAARVIAREVAQPTVYFLCAAHFSSNKNLASAGYTSGAQAEVEIGKVFVANGLESAFACAVEIIKRSAHYVDNYKK